MKSVIKLTSLAAFFAGLFYIPVADARHVQIREEGRRQALTQQLSRKAVNQRLQKRKLPPHSKVPSTQLSKKSPPLRGGKITLARRRISPQRQTIYRFQKRRLASRQNARVNQHKSKPRQSTLKKKRSLTDTNRKIRPSARRAPLKKLRADRANKRVPIKRKNVKVSDKRNRHSLKRTPLKGTRTQPTSKRRAMAVNSRGSLKKQTARDLHLRPGVKAQTPRTRIEKKKTLSRTSPKKAPVTRNSSNPFRLNPKAVKKSPGPFKRKVVPQKPQKPQKHGLTNAEKGALAIVRKEFGKDIEKEFNKALKKKIKFKLAHQIDETATYKISPYKLPYDIRQGFEKGIRSRGVFYHTLAEYPLTGNLAKEWIKIFEKIDAATGQSTAQSVLDALTKI